MCAKRELPERTRLIEDSHVLRNVSIQTLEEPEVDVGIDQFIYERE